MTQDFQSLLVQLSDAISDDDLERMIFFCTDIIGRKQAEEISRPFQLWQVLKDRGQINEEEVSYLEGMFRTIKRSDLLQVVTDYKHAISSETNDYCISQGLFLLWLAFICLISLK